MISVNLAMVFTSTAVVSSSHLTQLSFAIKFLSSASQLQMAHVPLTQFLVNP